jgi:hypothetical protein
MPVDRVGDREGRVAAPAGEPRVALDADPLGDGPGRGERAARAGGLHRALSIV